MQTQREQQYYELKDPQDNIRRAHLSLMVAREPGLSGFAICAVRVFWVVVSGGDASEISALEFLHFREGR
jgi:hypothetical protein